MRNPFFRRAVLGLTILLLLATMRQSGSAQTGCPLEPGDVSDMQGVRTVFFATYASEDDRTEFRAKLRRMHLRVVDDPAQADVVLMLAITVVSTIGEPAEPEQNAQQSETSHNGDKTIAIVRVTGACSDRLVLRKRIPAKEAAGALSELFDTFAALYYRANGHARRVARAAETR